MVSRLKRPNINFEEKFFFILFEYLLQYSDLKTIAIMSVGTYVLDYSKIFCLIFVSICNFLWFLIVLKLLHYKNCVHN